LFFLVGDSVRWLRLLWGFSVLFKEMVVELDMKKTVQIEKMEALIYTVLLASFFFFFLAV